ncbi:AraC family transcriptional regulator [Fodinibius sp. Rm-B-1B1-1]|uniref:AraC family transcriptional regulator n=1 Tax=Fodinibius alkaliphilus TaxID=3140241 RepID=UPI00315B001B
MGKGQNKKTEIDYISRINAVFDYIEKNLDRDLSLDELAEVSCFSKYHFSRIFTGTVGETPFEFIRRVRLEKAVSMLRFHRHKTVTEIAMDCGYSDLAVFSRTFTEFFGNSPTKVRENGFKKSNIDQEIDAHNMQFERELNKNKNLEQLQRAEVLHLSEQTVAYIRYSGLYKKKRYLYEEYFNELLSWGNQQELVTPQDASLMAIYHDAPCVTGESKLRISFGLPVPADITTSGEIGKMNLPKGLFLKARFLIAPKNISVAWKWVYEYWFPRSGYRQADGLPFEVYSNFSENEETSVEIHVPLTSL